mmetsp:Transcript_26598/g.47792  ORF Transcript_26598/g.47792 Transcript_26598/m.47792 type:complete len:169 (-) Transcript_26598:4371-4877(-)
MLGLAGDFSLCLSQTSIKLMEEPLSSEELRHLLPSDLISEALDADYLEDPPNYAESHDDLDRFSMFALPSLELQFFNYTIPQKSSRKLCQTLKLSEELDFELLKQDLQKETDLLAGRTRVFLMKSLDLQAMTDDVRAHIRSLRRPKHKPSQRLGKENQEPRSFHGLSK